MATQSPQDVEAQEKEISGVEDDVIPSRTPESSMADAGVSFFLCHHC